MNTLTREHICTLVLKYFRKMDKKDQFGIVFY